VGKRGFSRTRPLAAPEEKKAPGHGFPKGGKEQAPLSSLEQEKGKGTADPAWNVPAGTFCPEKEGFAECEKEGRGGGKRKRWGAKTPQPSDRKKAPLFPGRKKEKGGPPQKGLPSSRLPNSNLTTRSKK